MEIHFKAAPRPTVPGNPERVRFIIKDSVGYYIRSGKHNFTEYSISTLAKVMHDEINCGGEGGEALVLNNFFH